MLFKELENYSPQVMLAALNKWEEHVKYLMTCTPYLPTAIETDFEDELNQTRNLQNMYKNIILERGIDICEVFANLNFRDGIASSEVKFGELSATLKMLQILKEVFLTIQPEEAEDIDITIQQLIRDRQIIEHNIIQEREKT